MVPPICLSSFKSMVCIMNIGLLELEKRKKQRIRTWKKRKYCLMMRRNIFSSFADEGRIKWSFIDRMIKNKEEAAEKSFSEFWLKLPPTLGPTPARPWPRPTHQEETPFPGKKNIERQSFKCHSSVVLSAPAVLRLRVRIPSTPSTLFSIYKVEFETVINIGIRKGQKEKEARIGPYF